MIQASTATPSPDTSDSRDSFDLAYDELDAWLSGRSTTEIAALTEEGASEALREHDR